MGEEILPFFNMFIIKKLNMSSYCKFYKQKQQVSYDNGVHWEDVPGATGKGDLIEVNSIDCGYVPPAPQYRQTSGTPYCSNADKYVEVYSQVSYDSGVSWETTATTQELVQAHSYDCGYRTRMVTGEPYCSGFDKYRDYYYQVSYNSGSSWTTTSTTSSLIEADSADCGYEPAHDYSQDYLTFVAKEPTSFYFSYSSGVYYSLDSGSTWTEISYNTYTPTVSAGQKVLWKASLTPQTVGSGNAPYGIGQFYSTGRFDVEGNAMSMLYGTNYHGFIGRNFNLTYSTYDYAFCRLFRDCTKLISAKNLSLPSTSVTSYCCAYMFSGCTSLTTAPELPATTLSNGCYFYMFVGCTSLNYVKCLATDITARNSTSNWLNGVASSGTFVKNSSMSSWPRGSSGIPENWSIQNATS